MKPYSKSKHISLLKKIRELFKANPEKKTITIKSRCSDCKCEVIIKITPSPGGYGLQGGALFECSPDGYFAKCSDCYKTRPEIDENYKPQNINVSLLDKVSEDGPDLIIE